MTQAVRLLSDPYRTQHERSAAEATNTSNKPDPSPSSPDLSDPFSSPHLTYTTNGHDTFPAPSAYASRKYAWIHIFPEGRVHQHPQRTMRYFKWGVARLILEPDECPDIVPVWIEGNEQIFHEARSFPRPVPRPGKAVRIWFGDNVGGEAATEGEGEGEGEGGGAFTDLRRRWRRLLERHGGARELGVLSDELKFGREAVELRKECTMRIRREVLRLRRMRGLPDEDPKDSFAETWKREGGGRKGRMEDGSWVGDT